MINIIPSKFHHSRHYEVRMKEKNNETVVPGVFPQTPELQILKQHGEQRSKGILIWWRKVDFPILT